MRECKRARRQPAGQFDAGLRPLLPSIPNPMSGWYVRWDVAYGWYQMDSAAASPGSANPVLNDLSKGLSGGGGRVTKATGCAPTSPSTIPASTIAERSLRPGDTTAKLEAITGLFNAYLDLGTWYCFTPYVGADRNFRVHQQAGAALHAATVQYAMASPGASWRHRDQFEPELRGRCRLPLPRSR
jgi:hypothetical protein